MGWRHWPAARALLVTLVIAIGLVDGCPLPGNKVTPAALLSTVKTLRQVRTAVMRPFLPVRDTFRLHQQWKLFPTANLNQHRMWIEGRSGRKGTWEILYRPNDAEHPFMADGIEYRRVRGAWNPGKSARRGYAGFGRWVAREVFAARPDIDEVRVRLENIRVVPRRGSFDSAGRFQFERTQRREVPRERPVIEQEQPAEEPEP